MSRPATIASQGAAISKPPLAGDAGVSAPETTRLRNGRTFGWLLMFVISLIALLDWLSARTERLYVDEDSIATEQQGTVWQHFGLQKNEVIPEIITADEARFTFPLSLSSRQTLQFIAHPDGEASYEIVLTTGSVSRQLALHKVDRPRAERISLPAGSGQLKFTVHGRIAWFDLRLTRQFHWPVYLVLVALLFFASSRIPHAKAGISHSAGNWLALGLSVVICLAIIEGVLRAVALKLPTPVLTARHDLGLSAPDPRWTESSRYRQRLPANLKSYCEWRHGDIVRMGFLPPDLFGGELHRYPFETDAEGFRNPAVRADIDVAALGDSFVEAMTSPREEAWPARLEQLTGLKVQNYGTSAFGPQQELYVLEDYAISHRPREVVVGYFAGNDLFDAERFDRWQHGGDRPGEEPSGWRLKKQFRRYETLFLASVIRVALPSRSPGNELPVDPSKMSPGSPRSDLTGATFDRGAFTVPTAFGIPVRFAFMPPYLQQVAAPRAEIERSRGWELVRSSLLKMRDTCVQHGSHFTVMFIPSKDEVYWPLVERSLGGDELQKALDVVSSYNHMALRAAAIRENRLAQNDLMREFCAASDISFLDLTPALEQAVASGRPVYFADDAHWNAAGHEVAAVELAKFLHLRP